MPYPGVFIVVLSLMLVLHMPTGRLSLVADTPYNIEPIPSHRLKHKPITLPINTPCKLEQNLLYNIYVVLMLLTERIT